MNDNLYKQMMNHGLLIYEKDNKYVLLKVPTPADHRSSISNEVTPHTNLLYFETWDAAFSKAQELCSKNQTVSCAAMLKFVHKGLGIIIWELSEQEAATPKEAQQAAEAEALKLMSEKYNVDKEVEEWEVKIRPLNK